MFIIVRGPDRNKKRHYGQEEGRVGRLKNELGLCKFGEVDKSLFGLYITVNCKNLSCEIGGTEWCLFLGFCILVSLLLCLTLWVAFMVCDD